MMDDSSSKGFPSTVQVSSASAINSARKPLFSALELSHIGKMISASCSLSCLLLCPFYVILLINSPGASTEQFIAFIAIAAVSALISVPLFNALAIPYRFWRRILPHKWLSYIILGGYYSSFFIIMLVLCYSPNWVTVSVLGVFFGVVRPPVPSRRGHFYRIPTYSQLFEIYIDNADMWEKNIEKSKKRSKL